VGTKIQHPTSYFYPLTLRTAEPRTLVMA
jgi:hypothetical protein